MHTAEVVNGKRSAVELTVCFLGPSVLVTGGGVRRGQMRESQLTEVHVRWKSEWQNWEDFDDAELRTLKVLSG